MINVTKALEFYFEILYLCSSQAGNKDTELQIRGGTEDNLKIIFLISH